jgi:hypothetical protein
MPKVIMRKGRRREKEGKGKGREERRASVFSSREESVSPMAIKVILPPQSEEQLI